MLSNRGNIVLLSNIEWNFLKQRHQYLAIGLANKGYNVIFVESAAKRNPEVKDIPRIMSRLINKLFKPRNKSINNTQVKIVTPFVLPSTFKLFRFFNSLVFVNRLAKEIKSNFIGDYRCKFIVYAPTSTNLQLINFLKPENIVYDCVSNFEAFPEMPSDTIDIENYLIHTSDSITVDCDFLYNKHKHKNESITILEPAVDFDKFNRFFNSELYVKKDMIKKIIYFGQVEPNKINIPLLNFLVDNGIDITIIGDVRTNLLSEKIKLLPVIESEQLPLFIKDFDAIILPYNINDYTNGIIPAKFYECFATGLPIIATLTYNFSKFKDLLITGNTFEEILLSVHSFKYNADLPSSLNRQKIARDNSWDDFTNKFIHILNNANS